MTWDVYRVYGKEDELLYIGCSGNALRRLGNHDYFERGEVGRVEIETHPSKTLALGAEYQAILDERPLRNQRPCPNDGPDLTPGEAAKLLGVTRQYVHVLFLRKRIKGRWDAKGWLRLDRESVEQLAQERKAAK